MKISVFGLGYVGVVSSACLGEMGHDVIGIDVDPHKVENVNDGQSPIVEELIGDLIATVVKKGRLRATLDSNEAVNESELSLICVGTPSQASGALETQYVEKVVREIGQAIAAKRKSQPNVKHTVVLRSTVLPGTTEEVVRPILEETTGTKDGEAFGLCFHPEFLREGSSVKDFREPPKIVIGSDDEETADKVASLYTEFSAPLFKTAIRVAEMVKYADNAYHAAKVVFGNEIGAICKSMDIDSHRVMQIFCSDEKLNISPAYLMPGFAYGGSCLPKDLRALLSLAAQGNLNLPLLSNIQKSNTEHLSRVLELIMELDIRAVGVLGLSFKAGTDDLRESPLVELVERLLGKGCRIRIYDSNVSLARLRGRNRAYIEQHLPHISDLLVGEADLEAASPIANRSALQAVIEASELIIIGAGSQEYAEALKENPEDKVVVDLVRLWKDTDDIPPFAAYHGICW